MEEQGRGRRASNVGTEGPPNLRRSSAQMPVTRQVGFHVEGVPPSPAGEVTLADAHLQAGANVAAGSPSPVIIPPTFQMEGKRTASLPVEAAATSLPDSHLADMMNELSSNAPRSPVRSSAEVTRSDAAELLGRREETGRDRTLRGGSAVLSPSRDAALALAQPSTAAEEPAAGSQQHHEAAAAAAASILPPVPPDSLPPQTSQSNFRRTTPPATPPGPRSPVAKPSSEAHRLRSSSEAASGSSAAQLQGVSPAATPPHTPARAAPAAVALTPAQASSAAAAELGQPQRGPPTDAAGKKPQTKAERRALQERQRLEKEARKSQQQGGKGGGTSGSASSRSAAAPSANISETFANAPARRSIDNGTSGSRGGDQPAAAHEGGSSTTRPSKPKGKGKGREQPAAATQSAQLFSHLQQYKVVTIESVLAESEVAGSVHPAVLQLGLHYADGSIRGGSARCVAMLSAFRRVVQDYSTPDGKMLSRDLTAVLNTAIQFLVECRPLAVSMGNAIKHLKTQVSKLDPSMSESAAKAAVVAIIDNYIQEKIVFAGDVLVRNAKVKVAADDVILTYAFSSVVLNILLKAQQDGVPFRVVVVDSRPALEGREMLRRLLEVGISATYVHINSLAYIMAEVSKVLLGAAAVHSNGTVMSRVGSATVAMTADSMGVPVIICCETYKFVPKVQLDSITSNELGNPNALVSVQGRPDIHALKDWQSQPNLALLSLTYDAMPAEYVSVIITEFGAIPPSSVPVILREYQQEPAL